ncbi:Signal transduction histidine kinase [Lentzea xinjiangensis]|uniref:histidine kinase n=1 Tax=Lentzea xinjiangensis TaxID=402600 RepID=A0A1H9JTT5_9PSEU|nr:sensor histidine kinase [Lentzea xinjiangensis]SEQ89935.1 Signal transduction histidine kinase [Lentzea xinjiangensis]
MDSIRFPLKHQSRLVAAVCMVVDGGFVLLGGCTWGQMWVVLGMTLAVDAMLAGPARLSGWVAAAQAALPLLVLLTMGQNFDANDAGMLIAGYRAGAWLRGGSAYAALGALSASLIACSLVVGHGPLTAVLVAAKAAVLPWLVGRYTTARRAYLAELEKRSAMEQLDAKAAVTKAITEERSAIARDLHDVIVHHVSAIGMHAGAARLGMPHGDTRLATSLRSVEIASRAAMVDLRHLLDLLHGDRSEGTRQPGLGNIDELLDGVRSAGTPARLDVRGRHRDVPESLDVTIYRIIQEMLTNAVRHGDSSGVTVILEYGRDELTVTAENAIGTGTGTGTNGTGTNRTGTARTGTARTGTARTGPVRRGLVGIRNRAGMFGGTTHSGLEPDGRTWRTVVTFPLEAS